MTVTEGGRWWDVVLIIMTVNMYGPRFLSVFSRSSVETCLREDMEFLKNKFSVWAMVNCSMVGQGERLENRPVGYYFWRWSEGTSFGFVRV